MIDVQLQLRTMPVVVRTAAEDSFCVSNLLAWPGAISICSAVHVAMSLSCQPF